MKGTIGSPRTKRARFGATPELKSETRINSEEKDPLLGHPDASQEGIPAPGTTQPGNEDSG